MPTRFQQVPLLPAITYPTVRRDGSHMDIYQSEEHKEVKISDPYHWLEQDGDETEEFVDGRIRISCFGLPVDLTLSGP